MLAVQLELAWLPSSSAYEAVVRFPLCGAAVSCTVVPMGTLLAVKTTAMGFVVPTGNWTSVAASTLPSGLAGADMPPMLVTASAGCPVEGKTGWGKLVTVSGVVDPLKLSVVASKRMRPLPLCHRHTRSPIPAAQTGSRCPRSSVRSIESPRRTRSLRQG